MNTQKIPTPLDDSGGGVLPSLVFSGLFMVVCGLLYPALATLIGGVLFPSQAKGSLVEHEGRTVGSRLVAQAFADARYFQPRPSAAGYDPKAASGSNLASSNPTLRERIAKDAAAVAARDVIEPTQIPSDLVTASGSGLDPDITPAAADVQAPRVARERGLSVDNVRGLIAVNTTGPTFGVFGKPRVNVLMVNLALDQAQTPVR